MKTERKDINKIISAVLTVVVVLIAALSAGNVLQNKFSDKYFLDRQNIKNFYDLPKNSIEVFVTGSSQIISGVSSPELYNEFGIAAYALGTCSQPVRAGYYWFSEMLKTQSPKVFIYEVSALYYPDKNEFSHARAFTDMKNTSLNKFNGLKELTDGDAEEMLTYYSSVYGYHSRWKELAKDDYAFADGVYKDSYLGFSILNQTYENENTRNNFIVSYTDNKTEVQEEVYLEYLRGMKEICDEEGITMILLKTPRTDWTSEEHSAIKDLADNLGLEYIDLNTAEHFDKLSLDYVNDFMDFKHLNINGARKVTSYIGKHLKENFELSDCRNKKRSYFAKEYAQYEEAVRTSLVPYVTHFSELSEYIDNKDYSFVLSKKGSLNFSDADLKVLELMGINRDINEKKNYVLVSDKGRIKEEHISNGSIEIRGFNLFGKYYHGMVNKDEMKAKFQEASKSSKKNDVMVLSIYDNTTSMKVATFVFDKELNVI